MAPLSWRHLKNFTLIQPRLSIFHFLKPNFRRHTNTFMFYVSKSQIVSILIWLKKNPEFVQKNIYLCIKGGVDFDLILLFSCSRQIQKSQSHRPSRVLNTHAACNVYSSIVMQQLHTGTLKKRMNTCSVHF